MKNICVVQIPMDIKRIEGYFIRNAKNIIKIRMAEIFMTGQTMLGYKVFSQSPNLLLMLSWVNFKAQLSLISGRNYYTI